MGTDVHYVAEKQLADGTWEEIQINWGEGRHYQLFAVLADVRNGVGFAGVPYGDPVHPISEPRGLPDDFNTVGYDYYGTELIPDEEFNKQYGLTGDDRIWKNTWMGDHSHTWLESSEILEWFNKPHHIYGQARVNKEDYNGLTYDKDGFPETGSLFGVDEKHNIAKRPPEKLTDEELSNPEIKTVTVYFPIDVNKELDYFRDLIQKAQDEHGEFRLVLGFDS